MPHPGLRESHKPLPEASVARLPAKRGKPADVSRVPDHQKMQLARAPFEGLPQRPLSRVEVKMVDEVLLAHPPGEIFIQNLGSLVKRLPEGVQIPFIQIIFPRIKRGLEFLCRSIAIHRRGITADLVITARSMHHDQRTAVVFK